MSTFDDGQASPRAVTLFDIALRCGVSKMTVSLALRERSDKLKPDTIARIQQAAREMGYDPAHAHIARSLAARRIGQTVSTKVIGFFSTLAPAYQPMFCAIVDGLQQVLSPQRVAVLTITDFAAEHGLPQAVARGDLDGVALFGPLEQSEATLAYLRQQPALARTPVVSLLHRLPGCRCVGIDAAQGSRLRFDHLVAQGHRRFLTILDAASPCMPHQLSAVQQGCDVHGFDYAAHVHCCEWRDDEARSLAHACARRCRQQQITAVLAPSDAVAQQMVQALWMEGLRVPDEVSVIGYGESDCPYPGHDSSVLTTVRLPWHEAGRTAAILLLSETNDADPGANVVLQPALIIRETSAPPPEAVMPMPDLAMEAMN
jgi:LacI family transcriptional regulator